MEVIKKIFDSITHNDLILAVGGFFGALLYAVQKKLSLAHAMVTVFLGTLSAVLLGPIVAHWLHVPHNDPSFLAGIGFLIGTMIKEVTELTFRIMDELEKDPAFIVNFIKTFINKFKK